MPFTLSHPAAVLLLRRSGLPMAGLVIGSMVPDLPMFGLVPYDYDRAHSLAGIGTVDLVAGVVSATLWMVLIRAAAIDACPVRLRDRLPRTVYGRRDWLLLPVAVLLGAATHVGWDEFTHTGRWGAEHIGWLAAQHLGHAGVQWAQAASSVLGLLTVVIFVLRVVLRRSPVPQRAHAPAVARAAVVVVAVAAAGAGCGYGAAEFHRGLHAAAIAAATHGLGALGVSTVIGAVVWRLAAARRTQRL